MKTAKQTISQIKWDSRYDYNAYSCSYLDRVINKLIDIKLSDIKRISDNFIIIDQLEIDGFEDIIRETYIPLHRLRRILNHRTKEIIWRRK